jgi:hypothetical protein
LLLLPTPQAGRPGSRGLRACAAPTIGGKLAVMSRALVVVVICVCGACGGDSGQLAAIADGGGNPLDARPAPEPPADSSVTYGATLTETTPVMYGGTGFCRYQITFRPLVMELGVTPAGRISRGHVVAHNVEAVVGDCPFSPTPENDATYRMQSYKALDTTSELIFDSAAANAPHARLSAQVAPSEGGVFIANLAFVRDDGVDPLLIWTVTQTLTLAPPTPVLPTEPPPDAPSM